MEHSHSAPPVASTRTDGESVTDGERRLPVADRNGFYTVAQVHAEAVRRLRARIAQTDDPELAEELEDTVDDIDDVFRSGDVAMMAAVRALMGLDA